MNKEKENYENQLQKYYSENKMKKYYSCNEVMEKMGISLRTVRYRLNVLKIKYKNIPALLYKEKNIWKIHRQLLTEFLPQRRRKNTSLNKKWKTLITWNTIDNFDENYHLQLISEIKEAFPYGNFSYTIEKTKKGVNHTHMVCDLTSAQILEKVETILNQYLPENEYRLKVERIQSPALTRNYFNK